jgi:hypothetical protein
VGSGCRNSTCASTLDAAVAEISRVGMTDIKTVN